MVDNNPITKGVDRRGMFYWQMDRPFNEEETKRYFLDRGKNFDVSLAKQAIEDGLKEVGFKGDAKKVRRLYERETSGSVNLVYKAEINDGKKVVIRIHPQGLKNGYFWVEAAATKSAKAAGVPVYDTLFIDDSQQKFPFDYMLMSAIPGKDMKSAGPFKLDLDRHLVEECGEYLAKIHAIKTAKFGFYDNNLAKKFGELKGIHDYWRSFVNTSFEDNLEYLIHTKVLTLKEVEKIREIFNRKKKLIICDDPRLVQNDLADWNVMTDGSRITGIIDWDECYSGDPVCDFSTWSVFFPFERMEHLKRGYLRVSTLPEGFEEKLHLYRLRYIISKMTGRKKKLLTTKSSFIQNSLDYSIKILRDEFAWHGVKV